MAAHPFCGGGDSPQRPARILLRLLQSAVGPARWSLRRALRRVCGCSRKGRPTPPQRCAASWDCEQGSRTPLSPCSPGGDTAARGGRAAYLRARRGGPHTGAAPGRGASGARVRATASRALMSAPARIRRRTQSAWPASLAQCRGVQNSCRRRSGRSPARTSELGTTNSRADTRGVREHGFGSHERGPLGCQAAG